MRSPTRDHLQYISFLITYIGFMTTHVGFMTTHLGFMMTLVGFLRCLSFSCVYQAENVEARPGTVAYRTLAKVKSPGQCIVSVELNLTALTTFCSSFFVRL